MDLHARYPAIADLRTRARRRLPKFVWEYLDSATGREQTQARNRAALDRLTMVPSILHGEFEPDYSINLLKHQMPLPFGVAPVGMSGLVWPQAERSLAAAAARWGIPFCLSTVAAAAPEDAETPPAGGGESREAGGARRHARHRRMDQAGRDDPLMLNIFEKILSWAEMINLNRRVDDADPEEARRAAEQLDELSLDDTDQQATTRLRMKLDLPDREVDTTPLAAVITYPEWHYRRGAYLPDHCAVHAGVADDTGETWQPDADARRRIARSGAGV